MNFTARMSWFGLLIALAVMMSGVPSSATEPPTCSDSPSLVVLPDCTAIWITTCFCEALDEETATIAWSTADSAEADTLACDGSLCVPNGGDLAGEVQVTAVGPRAGQVAKGNSTPSPKQAATISCTDCPEDDGDATVEWDLSKKNNHFDIEIADSVGTSICSVGLNVHRQTCDED